jgi:hypoxanthine phosphoribosyltransferase
MAAESLVLGLQGEGAELNLLDCHLLEEKADIKNAPPDAKISEWETILAKMGIQLSSDVDKRVVYVVDDLYQSGVSINAFARFLKLKGASHVLGLACVKSLRDTGNV